MSGSEVARFRLLGTSACRCSSNGSPARTPLSGNETLGLNITQLGHDAPLPQC